MSKRKKILITIVLFLAIGIPILYSAYDNTEIRFQIAKLIGLKSKPLSSQSDFSVQEFISGIPGPTTMAFVDDDILVLQKNDGKVRLIKDGVIQEKPVLDLNVNGKYESGLLGILALKSTVYLYLTESTQDGGQPIGDNIYRYTWNGQELVDPVLVNHFQVYDFSHHGGIMVTDSEDNIYIIRGDQRGDDYQKYGVLQNFGEGDVDDTGVIIRVGLNSSEPTPSLSSHPLDHYYAMGIRNSFGLAIDPVTGFMWDTENGDEGFDEINLVLPKFNSGWKKIMGPANETQVASLPPLGFTYSDPEFSWENSVAPTAIAFVGSALSEEYSDSVLVGDCRGNLYKFTLNATRTGFVFNDSNLQDLVANEGDSMIDVIIAKNLGCISDIKFGPDGTIYVTSYANNGAIFKITKSS